MAGSNIYLPGKWKSQTFTSSGNFTVPANVDQVFVEMYGGGGGGSRYNPPVGIGPYQNFGGEAGERVHANIPVTPGAVIAVTIGTGGAGATNVNFGGHLGADGTDTIFNSLKSRGGRGGGYLAMPGNVEPGELNLHGMGRGLDSFRASGGAFDSSFGGDAGFGNGGKGGDIFDAPTNGGIGAGGGGGLNVSAGSGGNGRCIVYWKAE